MVSRFNENRDIASINFSKLLENSRIEFSQETEGIASRTLRTIDSSNLENERERGAIELSLIGCHQQNWLLKKIPCNFLTYYLSI